MDVDIGMRASVFFVLQGETKSVTVVVFRDGYEIPIETVERTNG